MYKIVFDFLGLGKFDKILSRFENIPLDIFQGVCVRFRDKNTECGYCIENCPVSAIKIIDNHLEVDMTICNGCGICANVCPTGVLELKEMSDEKLLSRIEPALKHSKDIVLICKKLQKPRNNPEFKNAITISCMGRLNEAVLVGASILGASTIWLDSSSCDGCSEEKGREIVKEVASGVDGLFKVFNRETKIIISPDSPEHTSTQLKLGEDELTLEEELDQHSRRDFLRFFQKNVLATGALILESSIMDKLKVFQEPEKEKETGLEYRLSSKRNLLLNFLPELGKTSKRRILNEKLPFAQVKINNSCTACENCVLFCPTKALTKKIKRNKKAEINFDISYCTKCNVCKSICRDKAIEYLDYINPQFLTNGKKKSLIKYGVYECKKCKLKFSSLVETDYCKFCERKRKLFGD